MVAFILSALLLKTLFDSQTSKSGKNVVLTLFGMGIFEPLFMGGGEEGGGA